ncbi:MAG: sigma-70 family RNA polymerase sigma factor [Eubacterium sp.]|nr:sigma-70 family RNA polymerase sigma factor [Eubacterium sp.]
MADYTHCSDEELIARLRKNEYGIMDYILSKYKPLVRRRANALYLIGADTDDLIQEGMIGLFKAIQEYQLEKGTSFCHFAGLCVERQMYTAVEASRRKKHSPLNSYISFDSSDDYGVALADVLAGGAEENPESLLIGREDIEQRFLILRESLSKMEKQVFDYMLKGFDYRQIAEKMGKSPKAIDNAIQRMRAKAEGIER